MKKHLSANGNIIAVCQKIHQKGFISAYGGNVSMRTGGKVVITPTKCSLAEITEDDLVVIDLTGRKLFGVHQPSSETMLHLQIYERRPEVNGIVHTHPPACTAFAFCRKEIVPVTPEAKEYMKRVPLAPFHPVGSPELAHAVADRLEPGCDVVMLERHGLVTVGTLLNEAYNLTELAEETALMNLHIKIIGKD